MYEDLTQNYDPEIHEKYLMHDTPFQGWIKTLGAPCQRVVGALPSSPLPSPVLPSLPFPFLPFPPLPYLSPFLPSSPLEVGSLNISRGSGERCKLPQWPTNDFVHI